MDGNYVPYNPRTVEEIYKDFKGRRSGMIKALTNDANDFYQQCDPEKENLCLYGFPNEHWEVNLPAEEIPPELPEPCLGINFARNGMREEDWLSLVAVHSDAWLISVAFYFGSRFGFDRAERKRLFDLINDLPTIFEVVTRKQNARMGAYRNNNNNGSVSKVQVAFEPQFIMNIKGSQEEEDESFNDDDDDNDDNDDDDDDDDDEHADALCGACGANYGSGEFWICCDVCEKWFHGKCVKVTPARAEHIKQYKCPSCSNNKKSRPF